MEIIPVPSPPKRQHPKHDWNKIVQDADEAKGVWLWVKVPGGFSTSTVGSIQDGRNNYIDPDLYEVQSGETFTNEEGNRRCNMYIRRRSEAEIAQREKEKQ